MPVLSLACHLPHNTPHIPSRYNNEQTTKQTKAINNSYIYKYIMLMWHKPCRTFHPWCLCIKTRCLSIEWVNAACYRSLPLYIIPHGMCGLLHQAHSWININRVQRHMSLGINELRLYCNGLPWNSLIIIFQTVMENCSANAIKT